VRTLPWVTLLAVVLGQGLVVNGGTLRAASQQPAGEPPVSLERIREELDRDPPRLLNTAVPLQLAMPTFKSRVEQRVFVPTLQEHLRKEFALNTLQRQSADWAAACCGGYVWASGSYGVRLDPLFNSLEKALERRRLRKTREQIARELAELEVFRKAAAAKDK